MRIGVLQAFRARARAFCPGLLALACVAAVLGPGPASALTSAADMEKPRFDRPQWSERDLVPAWNGQAGAAPQTQTRAESEETASEPLATAVKGMTVYAGLFTLYENPNTGELFMAVRADQLNTPFIYFAHTVEGAPAAGYFRGSYRANQVFSIRKSYGRLEFLAQYTSTYFNPDSPLAKAATANTSPSPLSAPEIKAVSADGTTYLVDASELFFNESLHTLSGVPDAAQPAPPLRLSSLQDDLTRLHRIGNYQDNTDVVVDYVFEADAAGPIPPGVQVLGVADARTVRVRLQHSLIRMPPRGFRTRLDDPRIGFFTAESLDLTSLGTNPYRDRIQRWRLEKKDPDAAVSEPVKPIVWWIENTTPRAFRPTIKEAAEAWNIAFEAAGFKNAIVVKEQPDEADWDAGDIHYNVIRWVSSERPVSLGYGPAFVNPLTGEILGADIVLDFSFVTAMRVTDEIFKPQISHARSTVRHGAGALTAHTPAWGPLHGRHRCHQSGHMRRNMILAAATLYATDAEEGAIPRLIRESLFKLVLHEVGHTLGLTHNMMGSYYRSLDELHDRRSAQEGIVSASVMDYAAVNLAGPGRRQGRFYNTRPGPYDVWAIEFGYTPIKADPKAEQAWRRALLARSTEPGHGFGNDADALIAPGNGIDPRILPYDLSRQPMAYAAERIALGQRTLSRLVEAYSKDRPDWQGLYNAFQVLNADFRNSIHIISRYIGGVRIDRSAPGQQGASAPYRPVSYEDQKRAMALLATHVFGPQAQTMPAELLQHLQPRRRGFHFQGSPEDPKLQLIALTNQRAAIDYLLHPATMMRLTDSSLYGNRYSAAEMLTDLVDAAFTGDADGPIHVYRRQLQIDLVQALNAVQLGQSETGAWDFMARSAATQALDRARQHVAPTWFGWSDYGLDRETLAHRRAVRRELQLSF